jgi:excisionase family DNA binding protein
MIGKIWGRPFLVRPGIDMPSRKLKLTTDEITLPFTGELVKQFPPIMSPQQLAGLLGLRVKTIYEWLSKGRLDGSYRKRGKHALIWRNRAIDLIFNGKDWSDAR